MSSLLFRLNNVPEDEADAVRELLNGHAIDFYETPGGNWGFSVAGIWLRDEARLEEAKGLIADYQRIRSAEARAAYEAQRARGEAETLLDRLREHPFRVILYLLALGVIAYLSIAPFLQMLL